ncbi:MAG: TraB/GumN family protein [Deltaproteobacteria bacterium]|nr:TraB/GumN family protein [Deltaproteobacteria bacterium]
MNGWGEFTSSIAALVVLAALGCATAVPEAGCSTQPGSRTSAPLMWRVDEPVNGGVLYLFGSIHFDIEGASQFPDEVEAAYARSDELVVEIDVSDAARAELTAKMGERGRFETPTKLADVLSPRTLERLQEYLKERELPFSLVEGMKPWYITNVLVVMELREGGYEAEHGVDLQFIRRSDGKPLVEIESADEQLDLLDRLPLRIQEGMLWDALDQSREFDRATDQLIDAWRHGDERTLRELVFRPIGEGADFELFYEAIFFGRNETMTQRLAELTRDGNTRFVVLGVGHMLGPRRDGNTRFVVLGVGHMLGPRGIPSLLCDRGFEVRRVSGGDRASTAN